MAIKNLPALTIKDVDDGYLKVFERAELSSKSDPNVFTLVYVAGKTMKPVREYTGNILTDLVNPRKVDREAIVFGMKAYSIDDISYIKYDYANSEFIDDISKYQEIQIIK